MKYKKKKLIPIYIIGAGQLGILVSKIVERQNKYKVIGFIDFDVKKIGKKINGIKVLGNDYYLKKCVNKNKKNIVFAIGDIKKRENVIKIFKKFKINYPKIIDPSALILDKETTIGKGSIISIGARILNHCKIGSFSVVGTSSTILHNTILGNNSVIGGGSTIGASAKIGKNVLIGVGSSVSSGGINIGENSLVSSGSAVLKSVKANSKVIGNPAKIII